MELMIDGQRHRLTPLHLFRKVWNLPDSFSVNHFEAKKWEGLGSIKGAQARLAGLQRRLVEAVPPGIDHPTDLLHQVEALTTLFSLELSTANEQIRLREVEIEFAVAGFHSILHGVANRLIQRRLASPSPPPTAFNVAPIYQAWLDDTVRLSGTRHRFSHGNRQFEVRVIYCAYGRVGLAVTIEESPHYLLDTSLACPAASFMERLSVAVAERLCTAYLS